MANTKDKVFETAENIKPYVDRAMKDEKLRADVLSALQTARKLYGKLTEQNRGAVTLATRVATDDDIRDQLRDAVEDLRSASQRLKGKSDHHAGRNTVILIAGMALGILFNPFTGRETRRFLKDMVLGTSGDEDTFSTTNGNPTGGIAA
jgi:hypothetical protein